MYVLVLKPRIHVQSSHCGASVPASNLAKAILHPRRDNIFAWDLCQKYYLAVGFRSGVRFE